MLIIMFAIVWASSFAVLLVGAAAGINICLLTANILLIMIQSANVIYAFRNKRKDVAVALVVCLLISLALLWTTYIWSWNYTVKALTIGFE